MRQNQAAFAEAAKNFSKWRNRAALCFVFGGVMAYVGSTLDKDDLCKAAFSRAIMKQGAAGTISVDKEAVHAEAVLEGEENFRRLKTHNNFFTGGIALLTLFAGWRAWEGRKDVLALKAGRPAPLP